SAPSIAPEFMPGRLVATPRAVSRVANAVGSESAISLSFASPAGDGAAVAFCRPAVVVVVIVIVVSTVASHRNLQSLTPTSEVAFQLHLGARPHSPRERVLHRCRQTQQK